MERADCPSTPEGEKRQTEYARRFYTVVFSHPSPRLSPGGISRIQAGAAVLPEGLLPGT